MSRHRSLGKTAFVFAALTVLLTAGAMCYFSEMHAYVWGRLWEAALSDFIENDGPVYGPVVELKDFSWYSLEAFAALAASFLLIYLAGKWGVYTVLAGILWYALGYSVHDPANAVLLLPLVGGTIAGFLMRCDEPEFVRARTQWWEKVRVARLASQSVRAVDNSTA